MGDGNPRHLLQIAIIILCGKSAAFSYSGFHHCGAEETIESIQLDRVNFS